MPLSSSQVQKLIISGNAPSTIKRADKGKIFMEKDHVHFTDGSALNNDGTWKHGNRVLSKKEKSFIFGIGWKLP